MTDLATFSRRSFLIMPLALAACKPGQAAYEISGATMGTTFNVVVSNAGEDISQEQVRDAINGALRDVNASMSNWDPASEISRFNAYRDTDAVPVSSELAEVMQAAEAVHMASGGTFDTTVGPLIEVWGFGAPGTRPVPADTDVAQAKLRSGHANTLTVGSNNLQKKQSDAQVYLAAIGKGYGADHIGRALQSLGLTDYMVEIGGDLVTSGKNPDGLPWQIGIETPDIRDRSVANIIGVSGLGLASSGDYRNYFEVDGKRFSHVIDPTTGRPITHKTASATVLAENAMLADAWATAMLILGTERGLEIAQNRDIAVQFIERDADAAQLGFVNRTSAAFDRLTA